MKEKYNQDFGGDWTELKLQLVEKYLKAYAQIMKDKHFVYVYIDAFAGTGYRTLKDAEDQTFLPISELTEQESQRFLDGSARIALKVKPRFSRYIFIEQDPIRYKELDKLKEEFPDLAEDIILKNQDANEYIKENFGDNPAWMQKHRRRAVMFLDPFGMQVKWETINIIAKTQAIDLWLLFPLGVAVNRMLKKDAQIPVKWQERLTDLFGTEKWKEAFYEPRTERTLFGDIEYVGKVEKPFPQISKFFVERLKTIFSGVADNPLPLYNSRGNPLYLLCFAAGNPRGAKTAIDIARHILGG